LHRFWSTVIRPVLAAASPQIVVEVGAGAGAHTRLLTEFCRSRSIELHVVDPAPRFDPSRLGDGVAFHKQLSLDALPEIGAVDVALIDGDHNWYTVNHELRLLQRTARSAGRPTPLVICHDVCWPYGRRDLYYEPETIPAEYRHRWERAGIVPGEGGLQADRGLNPDLANAVHEGGPRNGVMTAIEDFVEAADEPIAVTVLPVLHGLAVVAPHSGLDLNPRLERVVARLGTPRGLAELTPMVKKERQRLLVMADERKRRLESRL
jgi:hypothetical protein